MILLNRVILDSPRTPRFFRQQALNDQAQLERRHRQDNAFLTFRRRFVFVNSAKNDLLSSPP